MVRSSRSKRSKRIQPSAAELNAVIKTKLIDATGSVLKTAIFWGSIVGIAYFANGMVMALAGKSTVADIGISFLGHVEISAMFSYAVGISGAAYGLGQRKLRRDTVERLQNRIKQLELQLDPGRTSSKLTSRGETRKEDR